MWRRSTSLSRNNPDVVLALPVLVMCFIKTCPCEASDDSVPSFNWENLLKGFGEGKNKPGRRSSTTSAPLSSTTSSFPTGSSCNFPFTIVSEKGGLGGGLGQVYEPVSQVDLPPRARPVPPIPSHSGGGELSPNGSGHHRSKAGLPPRASSAAPLTSSQNGGGLSEGDPSPRAKFASHALPRIKKVVGDGSSPDDFKVDLSPDRTDHFVLPVQLCSRTRTVVVRGRSGLLYLINNRSSPVAFDECWWRVEVPLGLHVAARLQLIFETCAPGVKLVWQREFFTTMNCYCFPQCGELNKPRMAFSPDNAMTFRMTFSERYEKPVNVTAFYILFNAVAHDGRRRLPAAMTSPATGYVTSPGFGSGAGYSQCTDATFDLPVGPGQVMVVSIPRLDLVHGFPYNPADTIGATKSTDRLELYDARGDARRLVASIPGGADFRPRVGSESLTLRMFSEDNRDRFSGFKMRFSLHPAAAPDAPTALDSGLLNCSGPNYASFKEHVHCDLERDCAGGEDEGGHCPFSSASCNGSVAVGDKCYASFRNGGPMTWHEASQACEDRGGILAGMRTGQERKAVERIFTYSRWWAPAWIGLRRTTPEVPHLYWRMWQWLDGVLAYSILVDYSAVRKYDALCSFLQPQFPGFVFAYDCAVSQFQRYFCEFEPAAGKTGMPGRARNDASAAATLADIAHKTADLWRGRPVTECPFGHVTLSFLSCDVASDCRAEQHRASCEARGRGEVAAAQGPGGADGAAAAAVTRGAGASSPVALAMFACGEGGTTLPYTLVCDYLPHCPNAFDETFCDHGGGCQGYACRSGQCFSFVRKCDAACDCLDCSDEDGCRSVTSKVFFSDLQQDRTEPRKEGPIFTMFETNWRFIYPRLPPPSVIEFDRLGRYAQRPMRGSESCPETHFRCAAAGSHCLPVYVRCNGVSDCPYHEDEEGCRFSRCPGFYRCRKSRVCVHADHVCDGWFQCPQRDDELYCALTCPPGCLCEGLAVVCSVRFPAREYPRTRYLDASRSGLNPDDLLFNTYLVWLKLASCDLDRVSRPLWPNLMHLDLSFNVLAVVSMSSFLAVPNLRTLILAGNPLVSLLGGSESVRQELLKSLDLSATSIREFHSSALSSYPHIATLNMSRCRHLIRIGDAGFQSTPYLINLDLSGSPVSQFPGSVFAGMNRLRTIFAANYKLCCKATLPDNFDGNFCFAPQDEISSCDDLLRSDTFRGCLWMFACFAVSGNLGCFLARLFFTDKTRRSGFSVFVTNLTVADFLMGVYLVMVGVADGVYRGQYLWHESTWKSSPACALAGFLSLLSSEMSAFIICLITVDRFIVLTFPFTTVRFRVWSAALTCGLVWTGAVFLASVPFLPMTPRWEFYGQTGICIPLPITRSRYPGQGYAFGVMILLNFVLFLLIALGQASIFRSVRANSMAVDSGRKSQDLVIARRLFTVAASDFLCWFPIGLLGLLSSVGVPVSSAVSVAMAIFVLPLNSAMNPFLYTFNVVMETRRKAREAQLMKILEGRIQAQKLPAA